MAKAAAHLTRSSAQSFLRQRDAEIAETKREQLADAEERASGEGRQTWGFMHGLIAAAAEDGWDVSEQVMAEAVSAWVSAAFRTVVATEEIEEEVDDEGDAWA